MRKTCCNIVPHHLTNDQKQARLAASPARPHTTNIVKQFLAKKGVVEIEHPPFSPDLNPPDFFLFPRLKLPLKGKKFDDIPDIQRNFTRRLSSTPKEDFFQTFQDMNSRSQRCIVMGGDFLEEQ
ncbi:histone-lysine N-methyltransferase SETMAR [Trichonephila clavipes]|nr:histone-lysine N-methyltransferase SETMAR [Trichonephila clavipes]